MEPNVDNSTGCDLNYMILRNWVESVFTLVHWIRMAGSEVKKSCLQGNSWLSLPIDSNKSRGEAGTAAFRVLPFNENLRVIRERIKHAGMDR